MYGCSVTVLPRSENGSVPHSPFACVETFGVPSGNRSTLTTFGRCRSTPATLSSLSSRTGATSSGPSSRSASVCRWRVWETSCPRS